jgi:ferredoxin
MIKLLVISLLFMTVPHLLPAQIGVSKIGISSIGADSLGIPAIGKAATAKCIAPGPCINSCPVYIFRGAGEWSIEGNWKDEIMPPVILTGCSQIVIDPVGNNECVLNVPMQTISPGTSITVMPGKRFRIPGQLVNH